MGWDYLYLMDGDNLSSLPSAALRAYEQLLTLTGTAARWSTLSGSLRAEAEHHTGDQRRKRLDRAVDCEARAFAAQWTTIGAFAMVDANRRVDADGYAATMARLAQNGGAL